MAKAIRTIQVTSAGATISGHVRTDGAAGGASDHQGVVLMQDGSDTPLAPALEATQSAQSAKLPASIGQKTMAGSMAVVLSSNQTAIPVTGGGSAQYAEDAVHASGDLGTISLAVRNDAGAALAGTSGDYIPLTTDNTGALRTTATLSGAIAYTPYRNFMTTAAVISALVSASARRLGYIHAFNVGAAPVFVRIYDKATAPATADTPVWSGVLPGNTAGAGVALPIPDGLALALGLGVRVTAAIADADNTALVANEVMVSLGYRTS